MRYGVPYKGSKNAIAKWIIDNLPGADWFIDVFAGGCAVTHAAMESGKYKHFLANDLTDTPAVFKAAIEGEFKGYSTVPSREEFNEYKNEDRAMALLYSYGNGGLHYLWGVDKESVKQAASRMVSAPSQYERRMAYRKFIREFAKYIKHEPAEKLQGLEGLERLQGLQRWKRLQGLQGLQGLEITKLDYKDVFLFGVPQSSIVYLDPPYKGTRTDGYANLDYSEFEEWLKSLTFPVVLSEYTCPKGFKVFASKEKRVHISKDNSQRNVECLCVQEQYFNDFKRRTLF